MDQFWLRVAGRIIDGIALRIIQAVVELPLSLMGMRQPVVPRNPTPVQILSLLAPSGGVFILSIVTVWL
jgi:hypothetical protein